MKIKVLVGLVVVASLSAAAVSLATQTGAAAPKPAATSSRAALTNAAPVARTAAATSSENAILWYAASQSGVPYCEGGGGINGPTVGSIASTCAKGVKGYDCMSLALYATYQGTGHKVILGTSNATDTGGTAVPRADLEPGDITYWGGSISDYHHSAVYAGNGNVWDAFEPGDTVQEHTMSFLTASYQYEGAYRYASLTHPVLAVSTTSLPGGTVYSVGHKTYSATLHATGGNTPYKWSKATGSKALPTGLTLAANGVISGKATKAGTFSFTVEVTSPASSGVAKQTATRALSIKITS